MGDARASSIDEVTHGSWDIFRYGYKTQLPKRLGGSDRGVWIDLATAAQKRRPVDILNQNLDWGQEKDKKNSSFKQS